MEVWCHQLSRFLGKKWSRRTSGQEKHKVIAPNDIWFLDILVSAKTRVYRYFLGVELRSEDLVWTLSRNPRGQLHISVTRYKTRGVAAEQRYRFRVFADNLKKINTLFENEQGTATYGPTQFSDLTEWEFKSSFLGLLLDKFVLRTINPVPEDIEFPESFDWRHYNVVSQVKNQGTCGSCWTFATTGSVEAQWAIKTKVLVPLSEQQLLDCDTVNAGCRGGLPIDAFDEIIRYERNDFSSMIFGVAAMAAWLFKKGPLAIGVNSNVLQFYKNGISHPWRLFCNPDKVDHAVLLVGYGVDTNNFLRKKIPYWIIKNSWGDTWGEEVSKPGNIGEDNNDRQRCLRRMRRATIVCIEETTRVV
ncbi:CTSF [Cordylochernes scorpioides]|uniref:CTSF n=1 Tax=Cordylochernes scorpioides TaxID=51811 RepID=A0ABY6LAW9_9ARAC|nr:CTSF [Cordylochernes scorpioides]